MIIKLHRWNQLFLLVILSHRRMIRRRLNMNYTLRYLFCFFARTQSKLKRRTIMKTQICVLFCVISVLCSLILTDTAIPASGNAGGVVATETATTEYVHVSDISYQVSRNTLSIIITLEPPVAGASVTAAIRFGGVSHAIIGGGRWNKNTTTRRNGKATIAISNAEMGEGYQTRVDEVVAPGYTWDGVTPDNGYNGDKVTTDPPHTFFPVEGIMFP